MWAQVAVAIVMMIASAVITQRQLKSIQSTTMEPGRLDIPQADEGRDHVMVFGTELIDDATIAWYGHSRMDAMYAQNEGKK